MSAKTLAARTLVASIAGKERWHPEQDTANHRRDLRAVQLEEHIKKVVDTFPPLTAEQRSQLAVIILGAPA
ncbi:MAG TPA: hypothetical protein VFI46_11980 [Jiangellaceae bacterium]|nr:hypothetical protein [Jiangellaceae bacterium]